METEEVTPLQQQQRLQIRSRIYFNSEDDLHLLREVVGQNPYENTNRWEVIQLNIMQISGKFITVRALKDRVNNLVKKFMEKDRALQFQSGIEEEITELDDLLRHIVELINEFKHRKSAVSKTKKQVCDTPVTPKAKKSRTDSSYQKGFNQKGFNQRALATESCTMASSTSTQSFQISPFEIINANRPNLDISCNEIEVINTNDQENIQNIYIYEDQQEYEDITKTDNSNKENSSNKCTPSTRNILKPTRKRAAGSLKQTTLAYLTKKNDRWFEIRSRELALQEREKTHQEEKFELEKWEKRKRIEMEEKRNNVELDLYKNQQRLIELAFERNK